MNNFLQRVIIEPFGRFFEKVLQFLPDFLSAILIFALAIAFGLGGRNIAKDYLEKKLLKGEEKDDIEHL